MIRESCTVRNDWVICSRGPNETIKGGKISKWNFSPVKMTEIWREVEPEKRVERDGGEKDRVRGSMRERGTAEDESSPV